MKKDIAYTELFKKYLDNACTTEEIALLLAHFGTIPEKDLRKSISEALHVEDEPVASRPDLKQHLALLYTNMLPQLKKEGADHPKIIPFYQRKAFLYFSAACISLVLIGIIAVFQQDYLKKGSNEWIASASVIDIPAAGNKAVLTLADGKVITLNEAAEGTLVNVAGMVIRKIGDGQLVYEISGKQSGTYNTITTPKGGTYQVKLADGTNVWLNAASSIRFPTSFVSLKDRKIELIGEAYFEVSKDAKHPFKVHTAHQEVEVLGTHFNISSYADDADVRTTLLEGAVKVSSLRENGTQVILKPGQQLVLAQGKIKINKADLEEVLAWKNGLFVFNDEPLEHIMRRVARWYGLEVVYEPGLDKNKLFGGSVSRFDHVSKVLRQLELTGGVHFKIEEGRIIAMK
ncbi:FecR family protein [Pedobacter gandavensis]|uniref:FecR family protein n=1 Tax=Pedobacter gandavensis TaxID=2679963 RepID=UPI00292DD532|nr:FecR domain-containing protein [Pedobacter gandavensis]